MKILSVRLLAAAAAVDELQSFYSDQLGFPAVTDGSTGHGFRAGETKVELTSVDGGAAFYHFALRVPRNRFAPAREWLARRAELLADADSGATTFQFANWNAEACYAHDPGGNIVELIAHYELPEEAPIGQPFTAAEVLGVCELGLVGPDTRAMASALESVGIGLWDGTLDVPGRLAFMGGRDGTLILAPTGRGWMPTGRTGEPHEVDVTVAGDRAGDVSLPGTPHRVRTVASR